MSILNHFALFSLPERYDVDVALLETKYRALVQTLHPDRQERTAARTQVLLDSASLNEAYRVLKDADQRAVYLLTLRGFPFTEEDRLSPTNQMIWMEVLSLQEELQEAWAAKDLPAIHQLEIQVQKRIDELQEERAQGFAAWEQGRAGAVEEVRAAHGSLRYYRRFQKQIREWLNEEEA